MNKISSYLTSLGIAGAVAFGTGFNGTLDWLIFVVVWIFILLGIFGALALGFAWGLFAFLPNQIDAAESSTKFKETKPNPWKSIPLSVIWLAAFVHVEWTVTAVVYLISTIALWISFLGIRSHIDKFLGAAKEENMIKHVKDPAVRQRLYDELKSKD